MDAHDSSTSDPAHRGRHGDIVAAIARFERDLPGWWFSLGVCSVSSDASCGPPRGAHAAAGPDSEGPDRGLLAASQFDAGFHTDLVVGTLEEALDQVRETALSARSRARDAEPAPAEPIEPTHRDFNFSYRNHEGRVDLHRRARVLGMRWGTSRWHLRPGLLLVAIDIAKGKRREFSVNCIGVEGLEPPGAPQPTDPPAT